MTDGSSANTGSIAADAVRSFVRRLEAVQDEIDGLNADKAAIYAEAKSLGLEVKALRYVVIKRKRRGANEQAYDELMEIAELYEMQLDGMTIASRARTRAA